MPVYRKVFSMARQTMLIPSFSVLRHPPQVFCVTLIHITPALRGGLVFYSSVMYLFLIQTPTVINRVDNFHLFIEFTCTISLVVDVYRYSINDPSIHLTLHTSRENLAFVFNLR
ncbi:hypothetical protein AZE42_12622 [Rhizopogon vesiculosus]|uniref:Uncharacterized protein n=1 Tax=Rhizopogon vesiculosus TaxID=180088 RepID=A0A1J8PFG4_9AGAM|nr:hypothetical protein AZE42_12622 [Rhizopogon vesiculosus]